jgi:hypothetical protein
MPLNEYLHGMDTPKHNDECKKVITMPQNTGVCWATAIFMATLFSQRSRNLLLTTLKSMSNTNELHAIILEILERRYKSVYTMKDYAYMFFQVISPEVILKKLYEVDKINFKFNPEERAEGYFNYTYLPKFYEFLGVRDILTLDYSNNTLYHSLVNNGLEIRTIDKTKNTYEIRKNALSVLTNTKDEYNVVLVYVNNDFKQTVQSYTQAL